MYTFLWCMFCNTCTDFVVEGWGPGGSYRSDQVSLRCFFNKIMLDFYCPVFSSVVMFIAV